MRGVAGDEEGIVVGDEGEEGGEAGLSGEEGVGGVVYGGGAVGGCVVGVYCLWGFGALAREFLGGGVDGGDWVHGKEWGIFTLL